MDTKRCLSCHKLLRVEAHRCSLCGYVFSHAPVRRSSKATNGSRRSGTASFPSNPPASPHRAGHSSGLHPEDQPFQSSFMPVLRPSAITRRLVEQESDEVLLPVVASSAAPQLAPVLEREQTPKRYVASPVPLALPMPQRYSAILSQMAAPVPLLEVETPPLAPEPTPHEQSTTPLPVPVYSPVKRQPRNRIVPILLLASCLLFLLATSILAYLLLDRRNVNSTLKATMSVSPLITISNQALIGVSNASLSCNLSSTTTSFSQPLHISNTGSASLNWTMSQSLPSWLSVDIPSGTLTPGLIAFVNVTCDSTGLQAGIYKYTLVVSDTDANTPVKPQHVQVTLSVT